MDSYSFDRKKGIAFLWSYPLAHNNGGIATITNTLANEFMRKGFHVIFIAVCPEKYIDGGSLYAITQYVIDITCTTEDRIRLFNQLLLKEDISCVINMATELWSFDLLDSIGSNVLKISTLERKPFEIDGVERMLYQRKYTTSLKGHLSKVIGVTFPFIPRYFFNRSCSVEYSRALEVSDYYVVLSEIYKDIIINHLKHCNKDKIVAIANPNSFSIPDIVKKEKKVLFCGRLENYCKNLSDLLKAWRIVESFYDDWSLEIIGDGEDLHHLKKLASKLKLKTVLFHGFVNDKQPYFEKASILCVPSLFEGWSTVLAEGMTNKCIPVVYDTFQSAHEVIVNGKNGFFVYSNNYRDLSSILISLMGKDNLDTFGDKAALAVSKYTPSFIVDKWIQLICRDTEGELIKFENNIEQSY